MQWRLRSIVVGSAGLLIFCLASVPLVMGDESRRDSPMEKASADLVMSETQQFESWPRVSDRLGWGPEQCIDPSPRQKFSVYFSESGDQATHGRKLYHLYAKFGDDYLALGADCDQANADGDRAAADTAVESRIGQIIVKRSWHPVEVDAWDVKWETDQMSRVGLAPTAEFVMKDDQWYRTGDKGPIFVMLKVAKGDAPDTDHGWIYATLTPDGGEVTAAGLIASCMECHAKAPHDRLFGLRYH